MTGPTLSEIAHGLYGAWRLLKRDPQGASHFRGDEEGFWNSFFAAVLVAPGYGVLVALHLSDFGPSADAVSTAVIHLEAYALTWLAYPAALHFLCVGLEREERWLGFVVALNWTKVIQLVLYLPLALLAATDLLGPGGSALATLLGMAIVLVYQWYVTRTLLDLPGMSAAGLTGIDLVLGIFITTAADAALAT